MVGNIRVKAFIEILATSFTIGMERSLWSVSLDTWKGSFLI